jgi:hypothetical protein
MQIQQHNAGEAMDLEEAPVAAAKKGTTSTLSKGTKKFKK